MDSGKLRIRDGSSRDRGSSRSSHRSRPSGVEVVEVVDVGEVVVLGSSWWRTLAFRASGSTGFHGIGVLGHRSSRTRTKAAGTNEHEELVAFPVGEDLVVSGTASVIRFMERSTCRPCVSMKLASWVLDFTTGTIGNRDRETSEIAFGEKRQRALRTRRQAVGEHVTEANVGDWENTSSRNANTTPGLVAQPGTGRADTATCSSNSNTTQHGSTTSGRRQSRSWPRPGRGAGLQGQERMKGSSRRVGQGGRG